MTVRKKGGNVPIKPNLSFGRMAHCYILSENVNDCEKKRWKCGNQAQLELSLKKGCFLNGPLLHSLWNKNDKKNDQKNWWWQKKRWKSRQSMQLQSSSTWAALACREVYFLSFLLQHSIGSEITLAIKMRVVSHSSSSQQSSFSFRNLSSYCWQRSVLPLCFAATFYWLWNHPGNDKERDKVKVFPHCSSN